LPIASRPASITSLIFFLPLIHHVLYLPASVPKRFIGRVCAIQTLVRNPLSSLCPGFWSQKNADSGAYS
jgi:hypothetical protein